jgi:molybdopterin converting factor small subunit
MHFHAAPPAESRASIHVTVRLFAQYAELLQDEAILLALEPPGTVGQAIARLRREHPRGQLLPERPLVAVNLRHVGVDQPLADGDEVALLPPLAGG